MKYKRCHGNHRPGSQPGAPLPPDGEGSVFLSPTATMATDAITIPEGGAPFRITETELSDRRICGTMPTSILDCAVSRVAERFLEIGHCSSDV